jgi:hypothetical protein
MQAKPQPANFEHSTVKLNGERRAVNHPSDDSQNSLGVSRRPEYIGRERISTDFLQ